MIGRPQIGLLAKTKWLAQFPTYGLEQISFKPETKLTVSRPNNLLKKIYTKEHNDFYGSKMKGTKEEKPPPP